MHPYRLQIVHPHSARHNKFKDIATRATSTGNVPDDPWLTSSSGVQPSTPSAASKQTQARGQPASASEHAADPFDLLGHTGISHQGWDDDADDDMDHDMDNEMNDSIDADGALVAARKDAEAQRRASGHEASTSYQSAADGQAQRQNAAKVGRSNTQPRRDHGRVGAKTRKQGTTRQRSSVAAKSMFGKARTPNEVLKSDILPQQNHAAAKQHQALMSGGKQSNRQQRANYHDNVTSLVNSNQPGLGAPDDQTLKSPKQTARDVGSGQTEWIGEDEGSAGATDHDHDDLLDALPDDAEQVDELLDDDDNDNDDNMKDLDKLYESLGGKSGQGLLDDVGPLWGKFERQVAGGDEQLQEEGKEEPDLSALADLAKGRAGRGHKKQLDYEDDALFSDNDEEGGEGLQQEMDDDEIVGGDLADVQGLGEVRQDVEGEVLDAVDGVNESADWRDGNLGRWSDADDADGPVVEAEFVDIIADNNEQDDTDDEGDTLILEKQIWKTGDLVELVLLLGRRGNVFNAATCVAALARWSKHYRALPVADRPAWTYHAVLIMLLTAVETYSQYLTPPQVATAFRATVQSDVVPDILQQQLLNRILEHGVPTFRAGEISSVIWSLGALAIRANGITSGNEARVGFQRRYNEMLLQQSAPACMLALAGGIIYCVTKLQRVDTLLVSLSEWSSAHVAGHICTTTQVACSAFCRFSSYWMNLRPITAITQTA